jgi:hypothetical protein
MVGIVDDSEFQSAAIRLRLSTVIHATLILLVLLTLSPLLWFWTAGDRMLVNRLGLAGVCATPIGGVVLLVVLACAVVTNRIDEHVLDGAMEQASDRIVALFDQELRSEILTLQQTATSLRKHSEAVQQSHSVAGSKLKEPKKYSGGSKKLSQLEKEFYCDHSDRDLPYDPSKLARKEPVSLLDDQGHQSVCANAGALTRTPALKLAFRGYFQRPKEDALWDPAPIRPHPRFPCFLVQNSQDHESLIPCIVNGLSGHSKRRANFGTTSELSADMPEVRYYLERIDSIVRGDVQTILAINARNDKTGDAVAFGTVRLNSLDRAVPPQHVDFAVIDRQTGETLFHSDDELAMVTNFADDVGGDPALWALLHSRARDTISLAYAGIPIRAHVRALREGMPWALIVYRGLEIEDSLTAVTSALAIFFTLLSLFAVLVAGILLMLAAYWRGTVSFDGLPSILGRVMQTASRIPWIAGAAAGLGLVLLGFLSFTSNSPLIWNSWHILPLLAICLVIVVVMLILYCILGTSNQAGTAKTRRSISSVVGPGATLSTPDPSPLECSKAVATGWKDDPAVARTSTSGNVLVLALIIFCIAVVPTGLWFGHHRTMLSDGLNYYLVDRTLETVNTARETFRLDMLREFGGGNAPARDRRTVRRPPEEQRTEEVWLYRALRSVMEFSTLSNELMIYRALPRAESDAARRSRGVDLDHVESLYRVFSDTFGYGMRWTAAVSRSTHLSLLWLTWLVILLLFTAGVAYSICSIFTIVERRRRRIENFPCTDSMKNLANGKSPYRAIVLYRNPENREEFGSEDGNELVPYEHHWTGNSPFKLAWAARRGTKEQNEEKKLYVFEDLEDVLAADARGRALLKELERIVNSNSSVLIRTRVVPAYKYSAFPGHTVRRVDGSPGGRIRRDRWIRLSGRFRFHVLGGEYQPEASDETSYFNETWMRSTDDERLQLYSLAHGGVANPRRIAALSSLVQRGILYFDAAGVVQFRNGRFSEFIAHDIDHDGLHTWRKAGGGGAWRVLWPPLASGAVLGLMFLAMANPEMRTTLLTAMLGLLPTALPFLRGGQSTGSTATPPAA